jgi:signal transduction histidine kinase
MRRDKRIFLALLLALIIVVSFWAYLIFNDAEKNAIVAYGFIVISLSAAVFVYFRKAFGIVAVNIICVYMGLLWIIFMLYYAYARSLQYMFALVIVAVMFAIMLIVEWEKIKNIFIKMSYALAHSVKAAYIGKALSCAVCLLFIYKGETIAHYIIAAITFVVGFIAPKEFMLEFFQIALNAIIKDEAERKRKIAEENNDENAQDIS